MLELVARQYPGSIESVSSVTVPPSLRELGITSEQIGTKGGSTYPALAFRHPLQAAA